MKKLSILYFCLYFLCSTFSVAQGGKKDAVYLKNGNIVKGKILSKQNGSYVLVKTAFNSILVFEPNKIDSIVKYKRPISNSGFTNLTEVGIMVGNSSNPLRAPFSLMNISSWKVYNGFTAGVGAGVEFFNETYLPVVADFRYYVRNYGALPFLSLQVGYAIPTGDSYSQYYYVQPMATDIVTKIWPGPSYYTGSVYPIGGMLLNPSIGINTPINESLSLTFSAGYRLMRHNYKDNSNYKLDVEYNRLSLKVGLMFK